MAAHKEAKLVTAETLRQRKKLMVEPTIFSISLKFGVGCQCALKLGKGKKNQVRVEPRDLFMLFNARNFKWLFFSAEGKHICNVAQLRRRVSTIPRNLIPCLAATERITVAPHMCQRLSHISLLRHVTRSACASCLRLPSNLYTARTLSKNMQVELALGKTFLTPVPVSPQAGWPHMPWATVILCFHLCLFGYTIPGMVCLLVFLLLLGHGFLPTETAHE